MNLCRECGVDFGSVAAFDAHRVGTHEYTYWEGLKQEPMKEDGRRCLSADEMEKDFALNAYGKLTLREGLEKARALGG